MRSVYQSNWIRACCGLQVVVLATTAVARPPEHDSPLVDRLEIKNRIKTQGTFGSVSSAGFDSLGVNLLSQTPISAFPGSGGANDVWGYVSPSGGEYAIIGLLVGTGFVDIRDPTNPVVIAVMPDAGSTWSDMAVYGEYAYNVNESSNGLQVFDLTQIDNGVVTMVREVDGDGWNTAHNVFCNVESGYIYPCGTNSAPGFVVYDLNTDPSDPQPVGFWANDYAHDLYVVNYDSCPTAASNPHSGQPCEVAFVFSANDLEIVDVTDKSNIISIASGIVRPGGWSYCHQGWLSEDRQYLFIGDETDSGGGSGVPSTTFIYDVSNLSSPTYVTSFTNGNAATDHNLMVRRNFIFAANYTSGLRIFDYSNIFNVQEVGYFKTSLLTEQHSYSGAWGVYSDLPSGVVLISDGQQGLFVLDPTPTVGCENDAQCNDGDPCTTDTCDNFACDHEQLAAGSSCDDGEACTINDECDAGGACAGVDLSAIPCVDDTPCSPATCDTQAGFCECIPCTAVSEPVVEDGFVTEKSRFISVKPMNPGVMTALRVTLVDLPAPFDVYNGEHRWVGMPQAVSELSGSVVNQAPTVTVAELSCEPVVADFGSFGTIHIRGDSIIPGAKYDIRATNKSCVDLGVNLYSDALQCTTSKWCDLVGTCVSDPCSPPNGSVDIVFDAVAMIDKFQNTPNAASKVRIDVSGDSPDLLINVLDISDVVAAFQGGQFSYGGPTPCN